MVKIAPSILAADKKKLAEEIISVSNAGADCIHIDVMDGKFVNNVTNGEEMMKAAIASTKLYLDVHLMVENPEKYISTYKNANCITFHIESVNDENVNELINAIKIYGIDVGIAIKPNTNVLKLEKYINIIDKVIVMTVEPGFGGQELIENTLEKVRELRMLNKDLNIEVDGGINLNTANKAISAGANILVAGTAIFSAENRKKVIEELRKS